MKMLRKINDYENLEISQESVYDGVVSVKLMPTVSRLQLFYKETSPQIFFPVCIEK